MEGGGGGGGAAIVLTKSPVDVAGYTACVSLLSDAGRCTGSCQFHC